MCSFQGTISDRTLFYPDGDNEDRTRDLLLARQALSQLSYTPLGSGTHLLSHAVPSVVLSAVRGLTIVFGMGTGVSPGRIGTGNFVIIVRTWTKQMAAGKLASLDVPLFGLTRGLPRPRKLCFRGSLQL